MKKLIIIDWAGNHLFIKEKFETVEDGFDFLQEQFPDEDDLSDYYVVPEESLKNVETLN